MKFAILATSVLLVFFLNWEQGKAQIDNDEDDDEASNEVDYEEDDEDEDEANNEVEYEDDDDDEGETLDEEYRDSRGLFKKKKKKKLKIKVGGGDDDDDDDEKCKSNDDCKFYKYCNSDKICVNKIGRRKRQWFDSFY